MDMTHTTTQGETGIHMKDGDDFVCPNCGCEIRLVHHGDPAKMPNMQMFTCAVAPRWRRSTPRADPAPRPNTKEGRVSGPPSVCVNSTRTVIPTGRTACRARPRVAMSPSGGERS